uniref:Uncharacterized protein n=1 Tax=Romanomermis culicivorax TaxID=13658 RepID=A0A915KXP4_ROMCU
MLIFFVQILVICVCDFERVSGIICYKCNESKRSPSDNCQSQAAFSCSDRNSAGRGGGLDDQKSAIKIVCRTTRTKIRQNLFSIVKDCTTEDEHLNRFQNGKAFGCETVYLNGTQEVTYCVCDQDQCNEKDIDEQIAEDEKLDSFLDTGDSSDENGQIKFMPAPTLKNSKTLVPSPASAANLDGNQRGRSKAMLSIYESSQEIHSPPIVRLSNDTILLPPNPVDVLTPASAVRNGVQNLGLLQQSNQQPQFSFIQQQQQRPTTRFLSAANDFSSPPISDPTFNNNDQWQQNFNCSFCDEIILQPNTDCQRKTILDCKKQLTTQDGKYFCYTKDTLLRTGEHRIEKRCTTDEIAQREIGTTAGGGAAVHNLCGQNYAGSPFEFQYCICTSPSCNNPALQHQQLLLQNSAATPKPRPLGAVTYPEPELRTALSQPHSTASLTTIPSTPATTSTNTIGKTSTESNVPSLKCYVCGESDSKIAECTQQYKYDCKRQYATPTSGDKMLCLTRKTRGANGLNYIEKRCIMQSEHQTQYPNAKEPVVAKGCGQAWEGYVEYCVCEGNFCNDKSLSDQQSGDPALVADRRETTTATASGELSSRETEPPRRETEPPPSSSTMAPIAVPTATTETTKTTAEGAGGKREEHKLESDEPGNGLELILRPNLLLFSSVIFAINWVKNRLTVVNQWLGGCAGLLRHGIHWYGQWQLGGNQLRC